MTSGSQRASAGVDRELVAVTGSTGRIGRRVVELLTGAGRQVRPLSRRNAPYDDPTRLQAALTGVHTLVFVSSDGEAARVLVHHRNVIAAAAACGVGRLVYLSGADVAADSPFCYAFTNRDTEQQLRRSELPSTILRANLFTEFLLDLLEQVARSSPDGQVRLPADDAAPVAPVSREDVAQCLAAAALSGLHATPLTITGPDSLTLGAMTTAAGYRYQETTAHDFAVLLTRAGEDPWWVHAYTTMLASVRQRRWQQATDHSQTLTGQRPQSVADVTTGGPPTNGQPGSTDQQLHGGRHV